MPPLPLALGQSERWCNKCHAKNDFPLVFLTPTALPGPRPKIPSAWYHMQMNQSFKFTSQLFILYTLTHTVSEQVSVSSSVNFHTRTSTRIYHPEGARDHFPHSCPSPANVLWPQCCDIHPQLPTAAHPFFLMCSIPLCDCINICLSILLLDIWIVSCLGYYK